MGKSSLKLLLPLLLLLAFAPNVSAQDEAGPQFKMPCQQVLKMGQSKFMDVYGERTQDYSNYGMKQAFGYYADCKRADNDTRAQRLTAERRKQVNEVRDALSKLGNAGWNMRYVAAGGGTMWGLASVGAYAEREDYMGVIIAAFTMPEKKNPLARRRANASLRRAQGVLAKHSRTPELEFADKSEIEQQRQVYQESVKEAREASAQLQELILALPDAPAERAAKRMADELDAALSNN